MVDSEIKEEKSAIEEYLLSTFSKIHDQYGQTLDITLALPTLVLLMSGETKALDNKVKKIDRKRERESFQNKK